MQRKKTKTRPAATERESERRMAEQTGKPEMTETELLREEAKQLLSDGKKEPEEKREGLKLMIRACDAGDPEAMYIIGKMLLEGKLIPKEGSGIEKGVSLLCRAAKKGSQQARAQLLWYRHLRYREIRKKGPVADGPLTGFDGKPIQISRTGRLTPVDAELSYENGENILTLSLNLAFVEDEKSIPDVKKLHEAVIRGIMSWAGEYTVFGGQKLRTEICVTTEERIFDNVLIYVCTGDVAEIISRTWKRMGTKKAKDAEQVLFREDRSTAVVGMKNWSVRSRKVICLRAKDGRFDNYDEITRTMRHEFGHVLGLGDLYAEPDRGLAGVPAGTWPELDAYLVDERAYGLVMYSGNGLISNNDMEMVVLAFSQNRPQVYQPQRFEKIVSEALGKGN